jgi:hypothetical protein
MNESGSGVLPPKVVVPVTTGGKLLPPLEEPPEVLAPLEEPPEVLAPLEEPPDEDPAPPEALAPLDEAAVLKRPLSTAMTVPFWAKRAAQILGGPAGVGVGTLAAVPALLLALLGSFAPPARMLISQAANAAVKMPTATSALFIVLLVFY